MFNFTVNNNQKVRPTGGKPYEYNTYREADAMARICYTVGQFDICYTGQFETVYNIQSNIFKLLKLLNKGENIISVDRIFRHENNLYMMVDGERVQIGKLKELKNNEFVFIY